VRIARRATGHQGAVLPPLRRPQVPKPLRALHFPPAQPCPTAPLPSPAGRMHRISPGTEWNRQPSHLPPRNSIATMHLRGKLGMEWNPLVALFHLPRFPRSPVPKINGNLRNSGRRCHGVLVQAFCSPVPGERCNFPVLSYVLQISQKTPWIYCIFSFQPHPW
jgi:hypothetical protein